MITVSINGLEVSGSAEDVRQLLGMAGSQSAVRRGPGRPPKASSSMAPGAQSAPAKARSSKPVSASTQRARKLQGQYMGFIRQLKAGDKAKVKAVLASKGKEAAIAEAQKLLK